MKMKNTVLVIGLFETSPTLDIEIFKNTFFFYPLPYHYIDIFYNRSSNSPESGIGNSHLSLGALGENFQVIFFF